MPLRQTHIHESLNGGVKRPRATHQELVDAFFDDLHEAQRQRDFAEEFLNAGLAMRRKLEQPGGLLNPIDLEPEPYSWQDAPSPPAQPSPPVATPVHVYDEDELPRARAPPCWHPQVQELD